MDGIYYIIFWKYALLLFSDSSLSYIGIQDQFEFSDFRLLSKSVILSSQDLVYAYRKFWSIFTYVAGSVRSTNVVQQVASLTIYRARKIMLEYIQ